MASPAPIASRRLIAPWYHTVIFLLILAGIACGGVYINRTSSPSSTATSSGAAAQQSQAILYLENIGAECLLIAFVFAGISKREGLRGLIGGGRTSWRQAALDFVIAAPFWVIWTAVAYLTWRLIGPHHGSRGPLTFPPHGFIDISAWLALSATAGFCEEIVYRGYFQQQFRAMTGSATVAILAQGILFGLGHTYQGWKPVFVITILGILYGLLAHWRHNLRANMISHAWSDMYEGYLKFLIGLPF